MTVEEKRQLELKTMRQIIGIYCHDKHHTPKGQLCEDCEEVWQYAQHRIDVCPHTWSIRRFVAYVKHIVMRRRTEEKSVKSCATVARGCYYTLQFRLFVICI